jgi:WD40 repeat protein
MLLLRKVMVVAMLAIASLSFVLGTGWIVYGAKAAPSVQAAKEPENKPKDSSPKAQKSDEPKANTPSVEDAAAEHKDQFGDPLPPGAVARLGTVRWRHSASIGQFSFFPNGNTIATAGNDDRIIIWDLATEKPLHSLKNLMSGGNPGVAFSPDGKTLAGAAHYEKKVRRWDTTTWAELPSWPLPSLSIGKLLFAPNGEFLACRCKTNGQQNVVAILDAATGQELCRIEGRTYYETPNIAFALDGKTWAYADKADKEISLYDSRSGKLVRRFAGHTGEAMSVAIAPDGRTIASTDSNSALRFWDIETGKSVGQKGRFHARYGLAYSPDGNELVSSIGVFEIATGKERSFPRPGPGSESEVLYSPSGKLLVSAIDHNLQLWDRSSLAPLHAENAHHRRVSAVSFSGDGRVIATAGGEWGMVRRWETTTGKPLPAFGGLSDHVYGLAYSPDGKTLAVGTGNNNGTIWLLDAETGTVLRTIVAPKSYVTSLAFSADGQSLLVDHGRERRLWDVATGKELWVFSGGSFDGRYFAMSPDARFFASTGSLGGEITLWGGPSGNETRTLPSNRVSTLAFSGNGKYLATAGHPEWPVQIWDVATGTVHWESKIELYDAWFLRFSPDGKTLARGSSSGEVCLWEVETGKERGWFNGHRQSVQATYSRDGRFLVTGSDDTTALVWDLLAFVQSDRNSPFVPQDLDALWADLGGGDAKKAYRALAILVRESSQSLPFLKKNVKAVPANDNPEIRKLVTALDDNRFAVRDEATQKLTALGHQAEPTLHKALAGQPTLEAKRRIDELLSKLEPRRSPEALRDLRALEVLERIGNAEAKVLMEAIAAGAPEVRKTFEAKESMKRWAGKTPAAR